MDYSSWVHFFDTLSQLNEDLAGLFFSHFTFPALNVFKEVTTLVILCYDVGLASFRELVNKPNHGGALFEQIECFAFWYSILHSVKLILLVINFFNDDVIAANAMLSNPNGFIRVLSDHLIELILGKVTVETLHAQDWVLCWDAFVDGSKKELYLVVLR